MKARDIVNPVNTLWVLLAAFLVFVVVNWLPGVVRGSGYSLKVSMLAISLFNFGGIAGALVLGVLIDRFGSHRVVVPAFAVAGVSLALLNSLSQSLPLFLAATLVAGFAGYGSAVTLGPLSVLTYPASLRTTGTGWVLGFGRLGGAVSPLVVAFALSSGMAT